MTFENIFQDYNILVVYVALYKWLDGIQCENIDHGLFTFINDVFLVFGYNRNFDKFKLNSF